MYRNAFTRFGRQGFADPCRATKKNDYSLTYTSLVSHSNPIFIMQICRGPTFVSDEIVEALCAKPRAICKGHDKVFFALWKHKIVVWCLVPFGILNVVNIEFAWRTKD